MKIQELIGKTIYEANFMKSISSEDTGYIRLKFSDNVEIIIQAYYDECILGTEGFEYATCINVYDIKDSRLQDDLMVDVNREE